MAKVEKLREFIRMLGEPGNKFVEFSKSKSYQIFSQLLLGGKIKIVPTIEGAYTEGSKIWLQYNVDEFPDVFTNEKGFERTLPENENRNHSLHFSFYCHEAAHILEGSFDINFSKILKDEYSNPEFAKELLNIVEDYRVETNMIERLICGDIIDLYFDFMNTYYTSKFAYKGEAFSDFMDMFLREAKCKRKGKLFTERPGLFDRYYGKDQEDVLHSSLEELVAYEDDFLTTPTSKVNEDGYATYGELLDFIVKKTKSLEGGTIVDSTNALRPIYDLIVKEFGTKIPPDLSKMRPCRSMGSGKGEADEVHDVDFSEFESGDIEVESTDDLNDRRHEIEKELAERAKKLNPDYGKEEEDSKDPASRLKRTPIFRPQIGKSGYVKIEKETLEETGYISCEGFNVLIQNTRREFELLNPNMRQILRRQQRPGAFNPLALYASQVDPMSTVDGRLYDAVHTNYFDWGLYCLLDRSGSTSQVMDGRPKIDIEKECATVLNRSVEGIDGISQYNYFFHSGRGATWIQEAPTVDHLAPCTALNSGNNDASAVRYVTDVILKNPHDDNILFLLADGYPVHAINEDPYYDLSRAINDATMANIKVFYLLIRPGGVDGISAEDREMFELITRHATAAFDISSANQVPYVATSVVHDHLGLNEVGW